MITGIWLYWVWVLVALILNYVLLTCCYYCDDHGNKTDDRAEYPLWMYFVLVLYPFVPLLNVVGAVFLIFMLWQAESRKDMYLRGRFFEPVKRSKPKTEEETEEGAE